MSQTPAMFRPLVRYVEFNGRSNRTEYWLFILLIYIVMGAGYGLIYAAGFKAGRFDLDTFLVGYMRFSPLLSVFSLATLLPYLGVSVRRLHDTGRTGWWLIGPVIVSFVSYILFFVVKGSEAMSVIMSMGQEMNSQMSDGGYMMDPAAMMKLEWPLIQLMLPWIMIPSILAQLALFVLMALPGDKADNRFGAVPPRG